MSTGNLIGTLSSIVDIFPSNSIARQNSMLNMKMLREMGDDEELRRSAKGSVRKGSRSPSGTGSASPIKSGSVSCCERSVRFSEDTTFAPKPKSVRKVRSSQDMCRMQDARKAVAVESKF